LSNEIIINALLHGIPNGEKGKIYIQIQEKEAGIFHLLMGRRTLIIQ
jgi:two-component sensor histidine kinase